MRVRVDAASRESTVPSIPDGPNRTVAVTADAVPVAEQSTDHVACEKLAEDAAQTTLMLVEFQKWYREQVEAFTRERLPQNVLTVKQ